MRENPLKPRVTLTTSGSKMKDKPLFGCPNRPAALIAAMAAALLLAPGTVFAQGAYYQFYNLALGIENVSPADSQYTEAFADLPAPGGKGSERGQLMVMAYSSVAQCRLVIPRPSGPPEVRGGGDRGGVLPKAPPPCAWLSHVHGSNLRRITEDWIGLSALGFSLGMEPGARAPGWDKVGPLALEVIGYISTGCEDVSQERPSAWSGCVMEETFMGEAQSGAAG